MAETINSLEDLGTVTPAAVANEAPVKLDVAAMNSKNVRAN